MPPTIPPIAAAEKPVLEDFDLFEDEEFAAASVFSGSELTAVVADESDADAVGCFVEGRATFDVGDALAYETVGT
jgi:hypothetical protein